MLEIDKTGTGDFLAGGGEMGALMRAHDWTATPLGPPESWPQSLRTVLRILLTTNHPMFIWWGDELIQFYNDAYRQTLGPERHPSALGQRGRDCWQEIWPIIGPQIAQVMGGGGPTWHENQLVPVTRHGRLEQVWWTYGYGPIDEDGRVGGVLVVCRDVTRDYLAAAALREREAELARVQQIGRIGGLEVNLATGFHNRRSPEYLVVHGLPPEAANETHADWVRRIHPEDRDATERQFLDAIRGEARDYTAQYRIIRPSDGATRWIAVRSVIERDENGRALRLVGAHTDVTEQVLAERASRQSEEAFRTLADALPNHVWSGGPDGMLTWFNPRAYEYSGFHPGELDAGAWSRMVHPDDAERTLKAWSRAVATGEPYENEFRLRRVDGVYRWFLARAVAARDEQGAIVRWIGTSTDVDDQKQIAAELAKLNATLEQRVQDKTRERDRIWNVSQDLLLVTDRDGGFLTLNPAWQRTLGWSETDLLTHTADWLEHPEDLGVTRAQMQKLAAGEATVRFENRLRHQDGSYRWLSWTGVSDVDRNYAVARDVTAEKVAAERLKATEEALRQSQKMEAVGQLTGGIAHDFNNLLTGIVGSLDLMQVRLDQGRADNLSRYINAAMTSANRAAALTHRLLAFARRQPLVPKSVDVHQLVVSLEDLLRRTIGEAIDLEVAAAPGLWPTLCDPNQLESALLNLAINARDAMPEGGKLTIACNNVRFGGLNVELPALLPGDYVCIRVTDTGCGMSPEVAARAFDPFFTTKPIGQGTGLGLSMIYGFAQQSGGHVRLHSEPGRGTTAKLYLPRDHGEIAGAPEAAKGGAAHVANGEAVLVVEDEPVVRGVIVEMLQEQGYRAFEAVDGPSGLALLQRERIDLLVTDVGLPGINGRQLADQARQSRPDLKVLFMTGYAESAAIAGGFLEPGMELIAKPFDLDDLLARIKQLIEA
ncbi:PAS domain S-box-containing protein [Rhodopseudomonas rhenobacensis]|uniref:histidine kinase n=1 Tax=Rhodopseudomonas rhenobacensis TaxID=87461 RepID=A0A7W8E2I0_9BRAD|nr:PAS domain-containing protein [Rhodopseudomonas rhenobacensis]MBB5049926.1 PAS domain S-box-containing protein [Rhodopseudomonas rhenobacensis]